MKHKLYDIHKNYKDICPIFFNFSIVVLENYILKYQEKGNNVWHVSFQVGIILDICSNFINDIPPFIHIFLSKKTQIFFDHIHIFLYFKLFLFTSFLSWHLFSICIFIPFTSLFCSHLFSVRIFYSFASFFRLHLFSVCIFFL